MTSCWKRHFWTPPPHLISDVMQMSSFGRPTYPPKVRCHADVIINFGRPPPHLWDVINPIQHVILFLTGETSVDFGSRTDSFLIIWKYQLIYALDAGIASTSSLESSGSPSFVSFCLTRKSLTIKGINSDPVWFLEPFINTRFAVNTSFQDLTHLWMRCHHCVINSWPTYPPRCRCHADVIIWQTHLPT